MKKLLFILLSVCLLISFVACGEGVESDDVSDTLIESVEVSENTESVESETSASESAESESAEDNWFDDEDQSVTESDRWTNNH